MIEIITPCSRPQNLEKIKDYVGLHYPSIRWHICYDLSKVKEFNNIHNAVVTGIYGGVSGNAQRNKAIEGIKNMDSWVYCLDDDNLLHPDFHTLHSMDLSNYDIVTFDQQLQDGSIRNGNDPRETHIDQAQFMIRRSIHEPYTQDYNADGILIERLVKKYPDRWLYIPKVLSYYNRLIWERD